MFAVDNIKDIISGFQRSRMGNSVRDRIKIFEIAVLELFLKSLSRNCLISHEKLRDSVERLWKDTVVNLNDIKYVLVDNESFLILRESESFMPLWFTPKEGEVFVDIGAHVGKYALSVAKLVGSSGTVVAIEANLRNYQSLRKSIALNNLENLFAFNVAAWDSAGRLKLFNGHLGGHHSLKIDWKLGWSDVIARPVDSVLKELGIDHVDWIKIDVEGAEWEVLKGLKTTIEKDKPRIIAEISSENQRSFKKFMDENGYSMIEISPSYEGSIFGVSRKFGYFFCLPTEGI